MPSLQALPIELFDFIVDILVDIDIDAACSLLQTCTTYSQSREYHLVRYKCLWKKSGFPRRKRFPRCIKSEANLLQAQRWSSLSKKSPSFHVQSQWHRLPGSIDNAGSKVELSKAARLIGEWIYDVSIDRDALYCFEVGIEAGQEKLSAPIKITSKGPILSYDVDRDEGVLALLEDSKDGIQLTIYDHTHPGMGILQQGIVHKRSSRLKFAEVSVNQSSVMVSLDNDVVVFDWKSEEALIEVWSRNLNETTWDGMYVRGHLLSSQVVACIVLSTYRTIGSMRVRHGVIELYRLDQQFPKVADIILPEAVIDILQPRIMQEPYQYISFDVGGKRTLDHFLHDGLDGPSIIQVFSDTRLGSISSLCEILYPKAALALYSFDPSKPSHPVLGGEWLRSNFPILKGASPLQSSLHGHHMISTAKQGRNELIYWTYTGEESLQVRAVEVIYPLLASLKQDDNNHYFHIDLVNLDGPRALFTCFKCADQHNGTVLANETLCSFFGSFSSIL